MSFIGLFVAAVWAATLGQSAVACVLGLFSFFWLSFTGLLLGLTHDWFALPAGDVTPVVALFLISWLVVIVALTVFTLRLPSLFTAIFALVAIALAAVLATLQRSGSGSMHTSWGSGTCSAAVMNAN